MDVLDLTFDDLGELSPRDYDMLRIGVLTTVLEVARTEPEAVPLPGIFRAAFENELAFRKASVRS